MTVQEEVQAEATVVGEHCNPDVVTGSAEMVSQAVAEAPLSEAVTEAGGLAATEPAVTLNVAEEEWQRQ